MNVLKILPAQLDIQLFAGSTFDVTLTANNVNADGSIGSPVNLTGYTAVMIIFKDGDTQAQPQDMLSTSNGRITLGGVLGTIRLQSSSTIVAGYTFTRGRYNLVITSSAGVVSPLLSGLFELKALPC